MEVKNDKYKEIREKAIEFVKMNYSLYGVIELQGLINLLKTADCPRLFIIELVREILDELNFIPEDYNIYHEFADFVDEVHGLDDKHIVEIGGGIFARLANRIRDKQVNGKITVYDPRLATEKESDEMVLKRQRASAYTDIDDCDLIIGLMPCKGAEVLLDLALKNKKDFVLWLCEGGPHGDEFDFYEDEYEWRENMIDKARKGVKSNNMGKLRIKKLDKFSTEYPIIYNER